MFMTELLNYRILCDNFVQNGSLKEYFNSVCSHVCLEEYIDTFIRHTQDGKRIRAYLVKVGYELSGKKFDEEFLPVSMSYELFQTGVLVHDDIIDNSRTRRFKPSMFVELGDDHNGMSKAICTGDMGLMCALDIIASSNLSPETKCACICHQNRVFNNTIAGELLDIELSQKDEYTIEDVVEMYSLKTAQYTISGPLLLGAILSGLDEKNKEILANFGKNVGVAFQIRDDILGIFGDEKKVGKPVLSDMREGKKTILSAHFVKNAQQKDLEEFKRIYGKKSSAETELNIVRQMFTHSGSLEFANEECRRYTFLAKTSLEMLEIPEHCKDLLEELLQYMTSRES